MTAEPRRSGHAAISSAARVAAEDLAAFARLFRERRAMERAPDGQRSRANLRAMNRLAPAVQRHLEFLGRSWLQQSRDGGRPLALVHQLAFGDREDDEGAAERALAQLASVEATYRAGDADPTDARWRGRRRSFRRRYQYPRMTRLGGALLLAIVVYALVLRSCGSWGADDRPPPTTALPAHGHAHTERPF